MPRTRVTLGRGFYWAFNKCADAAKLEGQKVNQLKDMLKTKYLDVKHALRPYAPENVEGNAIEHAENMRRFRKEIAEMTADLDTALASKKRALAKEVKKVGKDLGTMTAKKTATAGVRYLITGGGDMVRDVLEVAIKVVPATVKVGGMAVAEKKQNIQAFADKGLAGHALVFCTGHILLATLEDDEPEWQSVEFTKARKTDRLGLMKTVVGVGKKTSVRREAEKLRVALQDYGNKIDLLMGEDPSQQPSLHTPFRVGMGKSSDEGNPEDDLVDYLDSADYREEAQIEVL
jgi:hypothetical protein